MESVSASLLLPLAVFTQRINYETDWKSVAPASPRWITVIHFEIEHRLRARIRHEAG